jgi:glycine C-acetyltransferase
VANLAVVPVLVGEGDFIFSDELNHASIIDACRLSKATTIRYKHNDIDNLEYNLSIALKDRPLKHNSPSTDHRALVITDGVFSMDGDIALLPKIVRVAKKHKAMTMVDDAHGEGVLGKNGKGIVDYFNLHGKVDIEIGTLSKAFGVVGGFAAGKKELIELLRQKARPFLFSSAMTFPDVGASIEAVKILQKSDNWLKLYGKMPIISKVN